MKLASIFLMVCVFCLAGCKEQDDAKGAAQQSNQSTAQGQQNEKDIMKFGTTPPPNPKDYGSHY